MFIAHHADTHPSHNSYPNGHAHLGVIHVHSWHFKELADVIKAAEKIESTSRPLTETFEAAVRAVALWATEEDASEIRATAEPLRAAAKSVAIACATAQSDAAALATAFSHIAELENKISVAEREYTRADQAGNRAEARVHKLKGRGENAQDAQVSV